MSLAHDPLIHALCLERADRMQLGSPIINQIPHTVKGLFRYWPGSPVTSVPPSLLGELLEEAEEGEVASSVQKSEDYNQEGPLQIYSTEIHEEMASSSSNVVGVHYRVGKKIGEGSFGVIFEGTNLLNNQQVAIKFVCIGYFSTFGIY